MPTTTLQNRGYVHSEVLVDTDWVADHLHDPNVRIAESNEDPLLYTSGHIPNAVEVDWTRDLNDPVRRDYLDEEGFAKLMRRIGVTKDTTVVLYGDKNNWWACYAFWVFQLFGHTKCRILDGGRTKWQSEGRPMVVDVPTFPPTNYDVSTRDDVTNRAFRDQVLDFVRSGGRTIDVRSPQEYTGERMHMPDYPNEGALRGGHIPHAANIPWATAVNAEDGTFKTAEELRAIYQGQHGFDPGGQAVTYCRIGERSSHTWFVLKYLLGFGDVRNYDGSWTEWGNLVGAPIEK